MTDGTDDTVAGSGRAGRRSTHAERRERRAQIEDPTAVLEAAGRFLEPRARSVSEVRRRLTSAGYRADLVEGVLVRLLDLGILDDTAFAQAWVDSRDRVRPRGERAMRQELAMKGVDREIVDLLLSDRRDAAAQPDADGFVTSADEVAAARLMARHSRSLARVPDPRQRRQRAYALLARNGFAPDVCRAVAARIDEGNISSEED